MAHSLIVFYCGLFPVPLLRRDFEDAPLFFPALSGLMLAGENEVWMSKLLDIILGEQGLPKRLYHYTSIDAFTEIVNSKKENRFLCTNFRFLNDINEFRKGCRLAGAWLEKYWGVCESIKAKVLAEIDRCVDEDQCYFDPWILSFSTERDATALWMSYTDRQRGGVAIGVSRDRLSRDIESLDRKVKRGMREEDFGQAIGGAALLPCIYLDETLFGSGDTIFEKALSYIFCERESFYCLARQDADKYAVCCARQVVRLAALVKGSDYAFENEWRIVFTPMAQKIGNKELFSRMVVCGGKPRISICRHLNNNIIDEVLVSPHGNSERVALLASMVKQTRGYRYNVSASNSSFVG